MTDQTNQCRPGFMVSPQLAQIPVALVFYKTNCLQRMDGKARSATEIALCTLKFGSYKSCHDWDIVSLERGAAVEPRLLPTV